MRYIYHSKLILIITIILLVSVTFINSPSYALIFSDDFDDNHMDNSFWDLESWSGGSLTVIPGVSETNQQLHITIPLNTSDIFGGGYITKGGFSGDFDAKVDFSIINWATENCGVRINLRLLDTLSVYMSRQGNSVQLATEDSYASIFYPSYPQPPEIAINPTDDLSGSLRMVRSGTTITTYYLGPTGWVEIGQCSDPEFAKPARFALDVTGKFDAAVPHEEIEIAFDNFTLNCDSQVAELPIPSAIMLLGSGLFGLAVYGRKKRPS